MSPKLKKTLGYTSLAISVLLWGIIALLPFSGLDVGKIAMATTVLLVVAEGLFIASVALLGKEIMGRIKQFFKSLFKSKK